MAMRRKHKTWRRNLKCKYLSIEKEFQHTVDEISPQLFEMNNKLKIWRNPFKVHKHFSLFSKGIIWRISRESFDQESPKISWCQHMDIQRLSSSTSVSWKTRRTSISASARSYNQVKALISKYSLLLSPGYLFIYFLSFFEFWTRRTLAIEVDEMAINQC